MPAAALPTAVEKNKKQTAAAGPGAALPSAAADAAGAGEVVVGCSGEPGGCVGTRTAVRVFVPLGLFTMLGMLLMWSYYKFQVTAAFTAACTAAFTAALLLLYCCVSPRFTEVHVHTDVHRTSFNFSEHLVPFFFFTPRPLNPLTAVYEALSY